MEPQDRVAVAQRKPRKRLRAIVEADLKERPQPKKRKKAGNLAELPNMPLDILFEVALTILALLISNCLLDLRTSPSLRSAQVGEN